jgi:hypothetical protein
LVPFRWLFVLDAVMAPDQEANESLRAANLYKLITIGEQRAGGGKPFGCGNNFNSTKQNKDPKGGASRKKAES